MSQARAEKINSAINYCLDNFYEPYPNAAAISDYLAELRKDPRWLDWEVQEVEDAVSHTAELIGQ